MHTSLVSRTATAFLEGLAFVAMVAGIIAICILLDTPPAMAAESAMVATSNGLSAMFGLGMAIGAIVGGSIGATLMAAACVAGRDDDARGYDGEHAELIKPEGR